MILPRWWPVHGSGRQYTSHGVMAVVPGLAVRLRIPGTINTKESMYVNHILHSTSPLCNWLKALLPHGLPLYKVRTGAV